MTNPKNSYKSLSAQLDEIINKLQNGDLDIDQAADAYQAGMGLIQKLEQHLKTAQNKVKKIKSSF